MQLSVSFWIKNKCQKQANFEWSTVWNSSFADSPDSFYAMQAHLNFVVDSFCLLPKQLQRCVYVLLDVGAWTILMMAATSAFGDLCHIMVSTRILNSHVFHWYHFFWLC